MSDGEGRQSPGEQREIHSVSWGRERERERFIRHRRLNPSKFNPTRTWDLRHGMESRFVPVERWGEGDEFVIWKCICAPHLKRWPAWNMLAKDWCVSEESWQEENSCGGTQLRLHTCHLILPAFLLLLLSRCCSFNLYPLGRINPEASNAVHFMSVRLMLLLLYILRSVDSYFFYFNKFYWVRYLIFSVF